VKRILVGGAVLALGISSMGLAQAQSGFKVTGGGQTITNADADAGGSSAVRGPGDTFGFNAQAVDGDTDDAAKGQFNTIQRDAEATVGRGKGEHIKGAVTCLVALEGGEQGAARFGGVVRGQESASDPLLFAVDVTDNGEGNAADDDVIVFRTFRQSELEDNENACDQEPENEQDEVILARGNVQVHNAE
jgi:hypothetical protein